MQFAASGNMTALKLRDDTYYTPNLSSPCISIWTFSSYTAATIIFFPLKKRKKKEKKCLDDFYLQTPGTDPSSQGFWAANLNVNILT